jgi:mRNA interferase RelE/StbE
VTYALDLGAVRRDLRALDEPTRRRVLRAIMRLEDDPRPTAAKQLRGTGELWRLRVGRYRILYAIDDERRVVIAIHVAHRREAYRRLP